MTVQARREPSRGTQVKASSPGPADEVSSSEREANPVSIALGRSLKALRIERDLSQEQLAARAEMDRTLISRIERGVSNPSLLTLSTICFVLDALLSDLVAPIKENAKPRWVDANAPKRRANQAAGDAREAPVRRLR